MDEISKIVDEAVKVATNKLREEFKNEISAVMTELQALQAENVELKTRVTNAERAEEKNEQYNRKSSLILGGEGVPLPKTDHETTSETRAMVTDVIKNKLKVNMQGAIVACHRLKNRKRVLVKFQDMDDREAVYQARFDKTLDDKNKVIIHENLTETRATMIRRLGQMREKNMVVNYHTKNGVIYARNSRDSRYSVIEPWLTEHEIVEVMQGGKKQETTTRTFMRSQTLDNIPSGRVAGRVSDLSDYVVTSHRQTRQQAKQNMH